MQSFQYPRLLSSNSSITQTKILAMRSTPSLLLPNTVQLQPRNVSAKMSVGKSYPNGEGSRGRPDSSSGLAAVRGTWGNFKTCIHHKRGNEVQTELSGTLLIGGQQCASAGRSRGRQNSGNLPSFTVRAVFQCRSHRPLGVAISTLSKCRRAWPVCPVVRVHVIHFRPRLPLFSRQGPGRKRERCEYGER